VHTSEGATTFRSLGNYLAQPSSLVSYNVGFDDTSASEIGEYVAPPLTPWAAMAANSWGEHGCCCTPSGGAKWSRDQWLTHDVMLRACGTWLGEEATRYRIPLVKIGAADITAGAAGVCGHGDCSAAGAGGSHYDPGDGFPWDVVLVYAGTGSQGDGDLTSEEHQMLVNMQDATHRIEVRWDAFVRELGEMESRQVDMANALGRVEARQEEFAAALDPAAGAPGQARSRAVK
jgi:hypothetical protein